MRRLPGILLLTVATLIVIVALLISGLRLVLPHVNSWREPALVKIEQLTGIPVSVSQIHATWQTFGPVLDVRDIDVRLKDHGTLTIKRVTLALDIWQSLLHARWQFRDLTFYQLNAVTDTSLAQNGESTDFEVSRLNDLFLRQFDHFDLRDSNIRFRTLSGQWADLHIPRLTWVNSSSRHRAEGQISLSSFNGQHGLVNVRMDLRDNNGLLNTGTVWMQADDVDVKPWFDDWMKQNVALEHARFSMATWVNIKAGLVDSADIWLQKGGADWAGEKQPHQLSVNNLVAHVSKAGEGWRVKFPLSGITLDGQTWSRGQLGLAWLPGKTESNPSDELRVRASQLQPENLAPLLPLARHFSPEFVDIWQTMQPAGMVDTLALDIPLAHPETLRLQARWSNLSWKQWKLIPGAEHVSGVVGGSLPDGRLSVSTDNAKMPYEKVFRAPLEIAKGNATLRWHNAQDGFWLEGHNIDVSAKAVRVAGDFRYQHPSDDEPWLSILAGISTDDGSQAWRYFPENLMGTELVDYLSGAIQGGKATDATLVYAGNPHFFPYFHNEGQFEIFVPLKASTFAFQPDWPALTNLNIDLDFANNGLWMQAPQVALGGVSVKNLSAAIPDYSKEKLLIDSDIQGPGDAVGPYFKETPLADSLGAALDEIKIKGDVSARLHLDIPLNGKMTTAQGNVRLQDNTLLIKPLNSTLSHVSGTFRFTNGELHSDPLQATWFNQPVNLDFSTTEGEKSYQVRVNLSGAWQSDKTGVLPAAISEKLQGEIPWQGKVAVDLPHHGEATYQVGITSDLKSVSSHLPLPADKASGQSVPLVITASGDMKGFTLTGNLGADNHFNSHWLLRQKLTLDRAIWATDSRSVPPLPDHEGVELNLPALDGAQWLAVLRQDDVDTVSHNASFPDSLTLRTPALTFGGQTWNNLSLVVRPVDGGKQVDIQGREINGTLLQHNNAPWNAAIKYLYYNPSWGNDAGKNPFHNEQGATAKIDFSQWPDLSIRCAECWLWGQKYGRIEGDLAIKNDTLTLTNGLVDTGFATLTASGEWVNRTGDVRTAIKGKLTGNKLDTATSFFGIDTPIQDASFDSEYDLHWRNMPWRPEEASLNGILKTRLGKGKIMELETGHAGQLLRLVSFDALLRKLRFDFSDTFSNGFYFDSARSTAWIKDGVLHTEDTLVDGLEADIAMKGTVDLVNRQLDMEAAVAPEISATVGVAAAFAVNPIVGAAVFAASRVLAPVWSKISLLRYRITGAIDKPKINEVLRQPREIKQQ